MARVSEKSQPATNYHWGGVADSAISDKMRVKIRVLEQDARNVQNGKALIRTASGGANDIVEELRHLKELALNSCNDHNTDIDRGILQKEFDARKAHIDNIARDTNFNGIPLLDGRWKRVIKGGEVIEGERLVSQTTTRNVVTTPGETTTETSADTKTIPAVTESKIISQTTATSATEVTPSVTVSDPVTNTSTTSETYTETNTTTLSSDRVTNELTETINGNTRTVVENATVTSKKVTSTSDVEKKTTTDTTKVTTTDVAVEYIKETKPTEPTIIKKGTTSITEDGVYEFAPNFTGTLNVHAANVQLQGPEGVTLKDVYITHSKPCDLYIKNLNIYNTKNQSTIDFHYSGTSTLHLVGTNNIETHTYPSNTTRAIIKAGGSSIMGTTKGVLNIVGGGSLNLELYERGQGAKIGSNAGNTCGDINIGQNVSISIVKTMSGSAGAGIGSGGDAGSGMFGACGNITIGTNAKIYIDMGGDITSYGTAGTAVGSGDSLEYFSDRGCKDIIIYSGANIEVKTGAGAGIGTSCYASECNDIIIYSDAQIKTSSGTGAGIGGGRNIFFRANRVGDITVYSYSNGDVVATSQQGENIGKGYDPRNDGVIGSVNLLDEYNHTEGGILDLSEMELPVIEYESWETTTTVTEETTTEKSIDETRSTTNEYFEETENIITTSVYEHYKEETPDKSGKPLIIHTGTKANINKPIYIEDMRLNALGVKDTKINTKEKAQESLAIIDAAIDYALDQATTLGAYYSGLEFTESNLTSAHENTVSSESVIRDADMAKEMTEFTKNNVIMQASQAMLSQANKNASSVLNLLQ